MWVIMVWLDVLRAKLIWPYCVVLEHSTVIQNKQSCCLDFVWGFFKSPKILTIFSKNLNFKYVIFCKISEDHWFCYSLCTAVIFCLLLQEFLVQDISLSTKFCCNFKPDGASYWNYLDYMDYQWNYKELGKYYLLASTLGFLHLI